MDNPSCRLLTESDVEQAAQIISSAYMNDPLCVFTLPGERSRQNTLRKFFRAYGVLNIKNQHGFGSGEPLSGVAIWLTPENPSLSISIKALAIFLPLLFTYYPIGLFRARRISRQTEILHQKYASGPHYYLDNLAVLPSEQGKGVASRLIRPFIYRADQENVIAYTDTVTRSNVPLYEHFGFQCVEECPIPGTGITLWALRRPVKNRSN